MPYAVNRRMPKFAVTQAVDGAKSMHCVSDILLDDKAAHLDVYLNLDDCILHYSPMCFLNFVHIVRLILQFILCN